MFVVMSEGKILFFGAGNWTSLVDGSWTPMNVLLHESFWFVDNSTTSPASTYDVQGSISIFLCIVAASSLTIIRLCSIKKFFFSKH